MNETATTKPFVYRRRVEFADTDMAGIAHFTSFFRFMEEAEHAFLRSVGVDVYLIDGGGVVSWPRASAKCDYKSPAHFGDVLEIAVTVARLGKKSITFHFEITDKGKLVCLGEYVTVCCRVTKASLVDPPKIEAIAIPKAIIERLLHPG